MKNDNSLQRILLLISKSEINYLNRLAEMLDEPGIDFFAPETKVAQGTWTLY